jgi:hypothetical protein
MNELTEALRQYRHSREDGLVFGYDKEITDQLFAILKTELKDAKMEIECEERRFKDLFDLLHEVSTRADKTVTERDKILVKLQADPHQWSTRPCQTCADISTIVGRSFGCVKVAKDKADNRR